MVDDVAALQSLESVMVEFFSPGTSNERKREIDQNLQEFARRIDSWRPCLHFLSSSSNNYVSMFALTTLETTIDRRWSSLPWEDRALIRSTLYVLSLEHGVALYVRKKVVKLVVHIARHDWPHFYPDFFTNILQLLGHSHTRLYGLIYLKTTSEELAAPKEDLTAYRKVELLKLLSSQVPVVLEMLTVLLCEMIKLHNRSGTVTPPPSPTGGEGMLPARTVLDVEGLGTGSSDVCIATLEVVAHLFSWIVLSDFVSPNLLDAIFTCAKYHDSMNGKQVQMAVQAMTTINELLYRPCSPAVTDKLLLQIFHNACALFQGIEHLDNIDECYMEKTTEFLQLFVTNHLKRVESCPKFPLKTLLELLYHRTFQQSCTANAYLRCLEVWTILLENAQSQYATISLVFAERLLQRISLRLEPRMLKELDTEVLDENGETEWQHFLRYNIECLAKVAEISPVPIFLLLYRSWQQGITIFGELGSAVANGQAISLNEAETANVHEYLIDLASMTQAMARLYTLFLCDDSESSVVEELVGQTLDACDFAQEKRLFAATIQPVGIVFDLVEVHSQLLASLQAWCHWIGKKPEKIRETLSQRCVHSCIWALSFTEPSNVPAKLIHSAAHLLQSIIVILKPNLWEHAGFRALLSQAHPRIEVETVKVLRMAIANGIVLPLGDGAVRQQLMNTLVSSLSESFGGPGQPIPTESTVIAATMSLKQLLEDCSSSSSATRKMLHECLEQTINRTLELLPHFIRHQSTCEALLSFLHAAFLVLQQQLGPEFTQNAIQGMLQIYTRENISAGPALDQFLEILISIVSAPSNAFKAFVPSITNLCLGHVWPAVSNDLGARPDTTLVLLRLFHSILMHRWQYFYNSSVLRTFNNTDGNENVEHKEELVAILEVFGQALLQPDINIFRQSLQSLEQLNTRWRLYQRAIFKTHLLERFLMALFTVLFHRSHDLLTDEIAVAIHSLAIVDSNCFFGQFLPKFLSSFDKVDNAQKFTLLDNFDKSTDQPTMIKSVLELVSDVRCLEICKSG